MTLSSPTQKQCNPRQPMLIECLMQCHCRSEKTHKKMFYSTSAHCNRFSKSTHEIGLASCSSSIPSFLAAATSFLNAFKNFPFLHDKTVADACWPSLLQREQHHSIFKVEHGCMSCHFPSSFCAQGMLHHFDIQPLIHEVILVFPPVATCLLQVLHLALPL